MDESVAAALGRGETRRSRVEFAATRYLPRLDVRLVVAQGQARDPERKGVEREKSLG
jgi:hypothetical protein